MATRKAQYLPRGSDMDEFEVDDIGTEREQSEEEIELFALIDDFNASDPKSQVRVYESKEPGPNTRGQLPLAYLFTFTPGQLSSQMLLDKVAEDHGPGNYEAHIYAPHPGHGGAIKLARKIKFEIGQTRDEKEDSLPFRRRRKSSGDSPSEIMRTFAEMMAAQNERTEAMIREVLNRQSGGIQDPISAMVQMMGVMVQFQQMMPKPPPAPSLIDEVQKLAMLKEIFSDIGGGGDTSESGVWLKMLDKFGTPLVNALGQPQPAQVPGAPVMQLPYQPQPHAQFPGYMTNPQARDPNKAMPMPPPQNAQIPHVPQPQPKPSQKDDPEMKANVNRLVGFAKMGIDAGYVAEQILNLTPEADEEKLYNFIAADNCIELMAAVNPEVNQHREFFNELRSHILAAFTQEGEEENAEAGDVHFADHGNLKSPDDGATLPETSGDKSAGETGKSA